MGFKAYVVLLLLGLAVALPPSLEAVSQTPDNQENAIEAAVEFTEHSNPQFKPITIRTPDNIKASDITTDILDIKKVPEEKKVEPPAVTPAVTPEHKSPVEEKKPEETTQKQPEVKKQEVKKEEEPKQPAKKQDEEPVQEKYTRNAGFVAGSRWIIKQKSESEKKPQLQQQSLPAQWFNTSSNSSPKPAPPKPVETHPTPSTPTTPSTPSTPTTTPQTKPAQPATKTPTAETNPSLRSDQVTKSNPAQAEEKFVPQPNPWQTPAPNVDQTEIENFMVYKNVVLIICSIIIVVVLCARIVSCCFSHQDDASMRKVRREEDRQQLTSESDFLKDPKQPSGNFIEINQDEEDQD